MTGDPKAAAIAAIRDARPPATDTLTYLMILESHLSADILPELDEILHDAELTQQIGWDLVYNLVSLPGSEACLETIARLGNPREVILKVVEALQLLHLGSSDDDDVSSDDEKPPIRTPKEKQFITLVGMLAILHKRIKTKFPSRFLSQTLRTVYETYQPTQEVTTAVIQLVHSLSGRRRPALPSRKSSVNIANLELNGDENGRTNAPDPEAEEKDDDSGDSHEEDMQRKLLLSFATGVLETYVNTHGMGWAARLMEFNSPEKLVPGRMTTMQAYREQQVLSERDAIVGKLVALISDLGIDAADVQAAFNGPSIHSNPLSTTEDVKNTNDVALSTGGCICLVAYWLFSATVFEADQTIPPINIFPDHFVAMEKFLEENPEEQIHRSPGTMESLVVIGLGLLQRKCLSADPAQLRARSMPTGDEASDFMRYLHLTTLVAVYHPRLRVRDAASTLAGNILHADPSEEDRLRILDDLLENCIFPSLQACAIGWLRDEMMAADKAGHQGAHLFASQQPLEEVQYAVFPNLDFLVSEAAEEEVVEYLAHNVPFLIQAANFGLFLWSAVGRWIKVLPANAEATVRERWWSPLTEALAKIKPETEGLPREVDVLRERLETLASAEGFSREGAERQEWIRKDQTLQEKDEATVGKFW